jgi:hypothetical protein
LLGVLLLMLLAAWHRILLLLLPLGLLSRQCALGRGAAAAVEVGQVQVAAHWGPGQQQQHSQQQQQ